MSRYGSIGDCQKLGRIANCIDNLEKSERKFIQEKVLQGRRVEGRSVVGDGWSSLFSRMVEFNFIENRTSMLRGKNERTFCWYYRRRRRRRRTVGVTSWDLVRRVRWSGHVAP